MNFIKQWGPLLVTVGGTVGAAALTPAFISAHPLAFAVVNIVAQILHAALPSVFGQKPSS
jgi:hypothetical protein